MKVKFSDKIHNKNAHLNKGTFRFHILEAPGCSLTIQDKRRVACDRARKEAPGCTFRIEQLG